VGVEEQRKAYRTETTFLIGLVGVEEQRKAYRTETTTVRWNDGGK
jgi:hypothetical protein